MTASPLESLRLPAPLTARPEAAWTWGDLSREERSATLDSIVAAQDESGFIPHSAAGRGDPWNHLESAMALMDGRHLEQADRALEWSLHHQRVDGSWPAELDRSGKPLNARVDTNCVAYLAVAVWHRYLVTGDDGAAAEMLPAVERALALVLSCQQPSGEVSWEIDERGRLGGYALLAASSSIHQALGAGASLAAALGAERPGLFSAAALLRRAIEGHLDGSGPANFAPKGEFAMDWYYPVLAGAIGGDAASRRLEERAASFCVEGVGVRCRRDERWVTTAETAECALAYGRAGDRSRAAALLASTRHQRMADGSYLTGLVHPERSEFPPGERTAYSAAAVLLADDALAGGAAARTFGWPVG